MGRVSSWKARRESLAARAGEAPGAEAATSVFERARSSLGSGRQPPCRRTCLPLLLLARLGRRGRRGDLELLGRLRTRRPGKHGPFVRPDRHRRGGVPRRCRRGHDSALVFLVGGTIVTVWFGMRAARGMYLVSALAWGVPGRRSGGPYALLFSSPQWRSSSRSSRPSSQRSKSTRHSVGC